MGNKAIMKTDYFVLKQDYLKRKKISVQDHWIKIGYFRYLILKMRGYLVRKEENYRG